MPSDHSPNSVKRRRPLLAAGTAAAIVVVGLGAFSFAPQVRDLSVQSTDTTQPARVFAAADPVSIAHTTPPRMLENGAPFSFADLVERVSPAVVTITAETMETTDNSDNLPAPFHDFFNQYGGGQNNAPHKAISAGSGFIVDRAGFIVTNNHVIDGARKITVKLPDGRSFDARLIGTDPQTDIALLKVNADKPLPTVEFGDDRGLRVGDWVVAVGNPFGLSNSVTAGIVSSLGRDLPGSGPYNDFIQIDAPINRGNSGGPTFDLRGQVVGMNSMIYSPSGGSVGIGFAIPSSVIHEVVAQLQAHGHVDRGYLGVNIQSITPEIAASLNISAPRGAIVATVVPDGPAAKAGFQQGDVIVSMNGHSIEDSRDLTRHIASLPAGQTASFAVLRNGQQISLTAKIGGRPNDQVAANSANPDGPQNGGDERQPNIQAMGLGLAAVTPDTRRTYNIDSGVDGVVVTRVDPDSDAGDKGIQPGDVVLSIANKPVHSPKDVIARVNEARAGGHKTVLLLVATQGGTRFVAVDISHA